MFWLNIDRGKSTTLTEQVYTELRDKILIGQLKPGEKLPSTRYLSAENGIARNIIIEVYNHLSAEGFLESREGSGTFVAPGSRLEQYRSEVDLTPSESSIAADTKQNTEIIDFAEVMPDYTSFPKKLWAECMKRAVLQATPDHLGYGPKKGVFELRKTIGEYLIKTKGIRFSLDQLMIMPGTGMGMFILARALKIQFHQIFVEDPGMRNLDRYFLNEGFMLKPAQMDENGMLVSLLPDKTEKSLISVTPSHHFPLGCRLPIQRRIKLIEFARRNASYIIENDYQSEFRHAGTPIDSLHLLDPEQVIHMGSLSGLLYPSLGLGYLIAPTKLIGLVDEALSKIPFINSSITQLALADFIKSGYLVRHVANMKRLYHKKRQFLIDALQSTFPGEIDILGDSTGQHLAIAFRRIVFSERVEKKLSEAMVRVFHVESQALKKGKHMNKIVLGYGSLTEKQIEFGVSRLAKAVRP
jgi:GntR family transcriptional regulator/MocR family aminotransferase